MPIPNPEEPAPTVNRDGAPDNGFYIFKLKDLVDAINSLATQMERANEIVLHGSRFVMENERRKKESESQK